MLIAVLDAAAALLALAASWLWFRASQGRVRRISHLEALDAADLNRLVVAVNRSQILNGRAALATALSAGVVGLRLALGLIGL